MILVLVSGCADFAGIGDPKPSAPDAPRAQCVFGDIDLCLYASPRKDIAIAAPLTIATDRDCDFVLNDPIGRPVCVLYARTIVINQKVVVRGLRPLVLAASDRIEINAVVDVSSYMSTSSVPAAGNDRDCAANGVTAAGAGGSFAGKGGDGGYNGANVRALAASAIPLPPYLRGGCGGGSSNNGDFNSLPANSGGAIALVAGAEIAVGPAGHILANGAGGSGADGGGAAGGGGSGGMIRIAAATVSVEGVVAANGGGGGEGIDGTTAGSPGMDGTLTQLPAAGGTGHAGGGDGGEGGAGSTIAGASGAQVAGSVDADGGGGGGAGFVVITGELVTTGTISPQPIRL